MLCTRRCIKYGRNRHFPYTVLCCAHVGASSTAVLVAKGQIAIILGRVARGVGGSTRARDLTTGQASERTTRRWVHACARPNGWRLTLIGKNALMSADFCDSAGDKALPCHPRNTGNRRSFRTFFPIRCHAQYQSVRHYKNVMPHRLICPCACCRLRPGPSFSHK